MDDFELVQELKRGVTWIGRGDFDVSLRAQLLCSRRQACFEFTDTGLRLECHGCNPVLFVVCHSKNFFGTEVRELVVGVRRIVNFGCDNFQ